MKSYYFGISLLFVCAFSAFGAAKQVSAKFKDQPPYFYAVLAQAAYEHNHDDAQKYLDKKLGTGVAMARQCTMFHGGIYGRTNLLAVTDNKNRLYIGIEGSTETGNWIRNLTAMFPQLNDKYNIDHRTRKKLHRIFKRWEEHNWPKSEHNCTLVAIVGHSQGGMLASQVGRSHEEHYTKPRTQKTKSGKKTKVLDRSKRQGRTTIIGFNTYYPIDRANQHHFATKHESFATLLSPGFAYIRLGKDNPNPASIKSNHTLKYIRRTLRGKSWDEYLKQQ